MREDITCTLPGGGTSSYCGSGFCSTCGWEEKEAERRKKLFEAEGFTKRGRKGHYIHYLKIERKEEANEKAD